MSALSDPVLPDPVLPEAVLPEAVLPEAVLREAVPSGSLANGSGSPRDLASALKIEAAPGLEMPQWKTAERERDAAVRRAAEAAKRAILARLDAAEQRARAERAEAQVERADARAERAEARAERAEARAERLSTERDALLQSTSWRVTKPLRAASGILQAGSGHILLMASGVVHRFMDPFRGERAPLGVLSRPDPPEPRRK